jgi:hypothetical protein
MKTLPRILPFVLLIAVATCFADDFTEVPNSVSPDGLLAARTAPPDDVMDGRDYLCIYRRKSGEAFKRLPLGSYAKYPMDADPDYLRLLWSPDSKRIAVMLRWGKREWTTLTYSVGGNTLDAIELPSATAAALAVISSKSNHRVYHEEPLKWPDIDHLLIRASGDTTLEGNVIWYEVDVTYSVIQKKITETKLVLTRPHEG